MRSGKAVTASPACRVCLLTRILETGSWTEQVPGPCGWTSEHDDQVLLAEMGERCQGGRAQVSVG
jgi:hypothetical protein